MSSEGIQDAWEGLSRKTSFSGLSHLSNITGQCHVDMWHSTEKNSCSPVPKRHLLLYFRNSCGLTHIDVVSELKVRFYSSAICVALMTETHCPACAFMRWCWFWLVLEVLIKLLDCWGFCGEEVEYSNDLYLTYPWKLHPRMQLLQIMTEKLLKIIAYLACKSHDAFFPQTARISCKSTSALHNFTLARFYILYRYLKLQIIQDQLK